MDPEVGAVLSGWIEQSPQETPCSSSMAVSAQVWLAAHLQKWYQVASAKKPERCRTLHGCGGGDGTFPNQIRKEAFRFWPGCPQRGWGKLQTQEAVETHGETDLPGDNPTVPTAPRSLRLAIDPGLDSYLETQRVEPQTL